MNSTKAASTYSLHKAALAALHLAYDYIESEKGIEQFDIFVWDQQSHEMKSLIWNLETKEWDINIVDEFEKESLLEIEGDGRDYYASIAIQFENRKHHMSDRVFEYQGAGYHTCLISWNAESKLYSFYNQVQDIEGFVEVA